MRLSTGIRQHPRLVGPALALSVAMALGALQASAQESQETQEREEQPQERQMAEGEDLLATAEQTGEISLFVRAVKQAGLAGELRDRGPYTVLAPTDEAFRQRFSEEELNRLLGMGQGVQGGEQGEADEARRRELLSLLRAHILTGEWPSDRLGEVQGIQNVLGDRLEVSAEVSEEARMQEQERTAREEPEEGQEMEPMEPAARTVAGTGLQVGGANVVRADIEAANGVIHLLDTLVEPEPAVEEVEEEVPPVEEERTEPPPPEEDPLPPPREDD